MTAPSQYGRFGSGNAVRRIEDDSLLAGAGRFADDVSLPGEAHLVFLRSPYPHARITSIDARAALSLPGVVAVLTGEELQRAGVKPLANTADFKRADGSPAASPPRHSLAVGIVRFVGEAVAAVLADTREQARDAVEAIDVRYDVLPHITEATDAVTPGSPLVWEQASGNIAAEAHYGDGAAATSAFRTAAHVVSLDLVNQRLAPSPLEPRALLASYDPASEQPDARRPTRLAVRRSARHPA